MLQQMLGEGLGPINTLAMYLETFPALQAEQGAPCGLCHPCFSSPTGLARSRRRLPGLHVSLTCLPPPRPGQTTRWDRESSSLNPPLVFPGLPHPQARCVSRQSFLT